MDRFGDGLSGISRYALKVLTAPNRFARARTLLAMLYPEAEVEGAQFSVWDSARERAASENGLTVVPEYANGII